MPLKLDSLIVLTLLAVGVVILENRNHTVIAASIAPPPTRANPAPCPPEAVAYRSYMAQRMTLLAFGVPDTDRTAPAPAFCDE